MQYCKRDILLLIDLRRIEGGAHCFVWLKELGNPTRLHHLMALCTDAYGSQLRVACVSRVLMSLRTDKFGTLLLIACVSGDNNLRRISTGCCTMLCASGRQLDGPASTLRAKAFIPGQARWGMRNFAETTKFVADGSAVDKMSKFSSAVRCQVSEGGSNLTSEDWMKKLPAQRKALYSHSLPCIEAWLHSLGFVQGNEDRSAWSIERPDWHAQLSLDVTDLYVRYLKKGPGDLERDIERKFSYALSREDLENAIVGGP